MCVGANLSVCMCTLVCMYAFVCVCVSVQYHYQYNHVAVYYTGQHNLAHVFSEVSDELGVIIDTYTHTLDLATPMIARLCANIVLVPEFHH